MLTRMEENPNAVFYGTELKTRFPEAFQQGIDSRLLRRLSTHLQSGYRDLGLNTTRLIVAEHGNIEAIDEEDPEDDPIPLTPDDLARYTLDLGVFALNVQQQNKLTGKPAPLTDRLFFLGEAESEGIIAAYVLALMNDSPGMDKILLELPSLLPAVYRRVLVACPSHTPAPTYRRQLEDLGIQVALLRPDNPLVLPSFGTPPQDSPSTESDFTHAPDFQWVRWRDREFTLTPQQATVVGMLHQAYRAGTPVLSWGQIQQRLSSIERYPTKMSDVFKRSPTWGTLVIKAAKGMYRLDL